MHTHLSVLLYVHYQSCYNPICSTVLNQTQYGLFTAKPGANCESHKNYHVKYTKIHWFY